MRRSLLIVGAFVFGVVVGLIVRWVPRQVSSCYVGVEWGSAAEWVGGVATAGAVAVAAFEIVAAGRRSRKTDVALRRSMAMAVVVSSLSRVDRGSGAFIVVRVDNCGTLPVFECQVDVILARRQPINARVGTIAGGGWREIEANLLGYRDDAADVETKWELRFRDAHGTVWRSRDGSISEVV